MLLDLPTMAPSDYRVRPGDHRAGRGRDVCRIGEAVAEVMARYDFAVEGEAAEADASTEEPELVLCPS